MAKQRTPFSGYFVGRLGTAVGAKLKGGEYVSRSYQPQVKNPNTLRQRVSRMKFASVSAVAAVFANPVKAGYGLAMNGTKMYPRNGFVKAMLAESGLVTYDTATGEVEINYGAMPVSQKCGIADAPSLNPPDTTSPGHIIVTVPAVASAVLDKPGKLGIVVVAYLEESNTVITRSGVVPTTGSLEIDIAGLSSHIGESGYVYAFYKWIPESGNDVPTETEPWKYPSETSATSLVGHITVG